MKLHIKLTFYITLLSTLLGFSQETTLHKIIKDGKIGFINNKGTTVIKPQYIEAGNFNDGLASFRVNGLYGYINTKGDVVLPAIYDYADSFKHGIAAVYIDGVVSFINKKGEKVLPDNFKSIRLINNTTCVYYTKNNKEGLYNIVTKKFITQPKNHKIGYFTNNVAIVTKKTTNSYSYAVINTSGKWVVNFGVYDQIENFSNNYAIVQINDSENEDKNSSGIINTEGKLLFKKQYNNHCFLKKGGSNGYFPISLYKNWKDKTYPYYNSANAYEGYVNTKGTIVFNDTLVSSVTDFTNKRAFITKNFHDYYVIDTHFNILNKEPFESYENEGFNNNHAIVETKTGWGIIDTDMNFIVPPTHKKIHDIGIIDDWFFYGSKDKNLNELFGIKNLKGETIVPAIIEEIDFRGFKNGLLKVVIDNELSYINKKGTLVWHEEKTTVTNKTKTHNITYMSPAHYHAYGVLKPDSNGWSVSNNIPKPITKQNTTTNQLTLIEENGQLFLKNFSKQGISLAAQDSRLDIKLQAKNKKGTWADIEYLPNSWCGNSYHTIALPSLYFWEFTLPKYQGSFNTELRATLSYTETGAEKPKTIYSNTFKGSVNPGQFWRKPNYKATGIMNPYMY